MFYSYKGDKKNAIKQMKLFSHQNNYHYWIILFFRVEPLIDNIKDHPEFNEIHNNIENKFWNNHRQIKASLMEKKLL